MLVTLSEMLKTREDPGTDWTQPSQLKMQPACGALSRRPLKHKTDSCAVGQHNKHRDCQGR